MQYEVSSAIQAIMYVKFVSFVFMDLKFLHIYFLQQP